MIISQIWISCLDIFSSILMDFQNSFNFCTILALQPTKLSLKMSSWFFEPLSVQFIGQNCQTSFNLLLLTIPEGRCTNSEQKLYNTYKGNQPLCDAYNWHLLPLSFPHAHFGQNNQTLVCLVHTNTHGVGHIKSEKKLKEISHCAPPATGACRRALFHRLHCTANYNELYHFLFKRYKVQTCHACGMSTDCKLLQPARQRRPMRLLRAPVGAAPGKRRPIWPRLAAL